MTWKDRARRIWQQFVQNQRGIVYTWSMVFMAMCVYAIVWFGLGFAVMKTIEGVEGFYTFTGDASNTVDLIKTVFAWHPVVCIVGWIVWGFVNSQRRDVYSYDV